MHLFNKEGYFSAISFMYFFKFTILSERRDHQVSLYKKQLQGALHVVFYLNVHGRMSVLRKIFSYIQSKYEFKYRKKSFEVDFL